ncbi:MAG: NifB/NifX family molybdenum-iron cluster-binding protein [Deltaproteobacteria bacterium]|nr:NifB/NifX family molybdenum-iron cluster-binding protein [Deltaproteobacteria bacterium]MBW1861374.1 NifB/NifX family molybdenum-iron cluster-binding protein [Deltaproteobacteria bacterium]
MKVALAVCENRISPLFDCARMLLIVDIVDRKETSRYFEPFHYESPFSRAAKLSALGIEILICGAVSNLFANMIETYGIRVISFIAGTVDEVLDAYLTNGLCDSKLRMPGCRSKGEGCFREEY